MKPFLQQVATLFYQEKGENIEHTIFVFPSRRASVFFQQYLLEMAEETFFAPACYTLSDFFKLLTPQYESEDKLGLLFRLYRHYQRITGSNESFDSFMSFGEILLKDFNDIDNYLVDAKLLYSNISDIKQLEDNSFLSPEQIEVLQRYLGYIHQSDKDFQSKTGSIWSILGKLYDTFTQQLLNEKRVYDGLLHRIICNQEDLCLPLCDEIVFVGFNAMDGVTKTIFRKLNLYLLYLTLHSDLLLFLSVTNSGSLSLKRPVSRQLLSAYSRLCLQRHWLTQYSLVCILSSVLKSSPFQQLSSSVLSHQQLPLLQLLWLFVNTRLKVL